MEYLPAKSDRQLGICLRMLYDEGYKGLVVESVINAKNRIPVRETVLGSGSGTWLSVSGLLPWTTAGFMKTGQIIFWIGLSAETTNTTVPAVSLQ